MLASGSPLLARESLAQLGDSNVSPFATLACQILQKAKEGGEDNDGCFDVQTSVSKK